MKKKLIITESQYKRLINEQFNSDYLEKVSRRIEPPYFEMMEEHFNVTDKKDQLEVLKYIYGNDIRIDGLIIYDFNSNEIYYEESSGYWSKYEYDTNNNFIYFENSEEEWSKYEYDSDNNIIYFENNYGKIIDRR